MSAKLCGRCGQPQDEHPRTTCSGEPRRSGEERRNLERLVREQLQGETPKDLVENRSGRDRRGGATPPAATSASE